MAFLTQSMNQFNQTPILGMVDLNFVPNVITVQILATSVATAIQVGSALKLVDGIGAVPIVDVCTGPTDGPVYGYIPFNNRKNTYAAGDLVECACEGTVLFLKTSAAIARGVKVTSAAATTTADPTVAGTATPSTDYIGGITLDKSTAANQLTRVQVAPSFNGTV